jgi:hypothetical protein
VGLKGNHNVPAMEKYGIDNNQRQTNLPVMDVALANQEVYHVNVAIVV